MKSPSIPKIYDPDLRDRLMAFIRRYVASHGVMPSFREMADAVGLVSSMLAIPLGALVDEGRLGRTLHRGRSLYFLPKDCPAPVAPLDRPAEPTPPRRTGGPGPRASTARPFLDFLKGPWRVGSADAVVSDQRVRQSLPLGDRSAEERDRDEVEYYGGYIVAESIPVELRPTIAVAPEALEVCLLIVRKAEDCNCIPFDHDDHHDADCVVGLALRVIGRFVEEFNRATEMANASSERVAEAMVVLRDLQARGVCDLGGTE